MFLHRYQNKNIFKLFIYGFAVGSIAEYILSYILEAIYGIRFWEYGYAKLHMNGRICVQYSIYWGLLSIVILKFIKPMIDRIIEKIPIKLKNILEILLITFFIINCIFTVWGIQTYQNRVVYHKTNQIQTNNIFVKLQQKIENEYFTNERISKTFPNLRIKDEKGNEIWVKTLITDNDE